MANNQQSGARVSNLKVFAVYDRDFDPLYAAQDECLHVNALDKADALKQGASALRCTVSDLKAFEVRS